MHGDSDKVRCLLEWCSSVGIRIDSRLELKESNAGISVFCRDEYISCLTTLVHISKSAVLSVKSCFLSNDIATEPYGHGGRLALALAVYVEILLGQNSHWFGYLQSLPQETVDLALFWGVGDDILAAHADESEIDIHFCGSLRFRDGQEALTWITGTELEKEMLVSAEADKTLLVEFTTQNL